MKQFPLQKPLTHQQTSIAQQQLQQLCYLHSVCELYSPSPADSLLFQLKATGLFCSWYSITSVMVDGSISHRIPSLNVFDVIRTSSRHKAANIFCDEATLTPSLYNTAAYSYCVLLWAAVQKACMLASIINFSSSYCRTDKGCRLFLYNEQINLILATTLYPCGRNKKVTSCTRQKNGMPLPLTSCLKQQSSSYFNHYDHSIPNLKLLYILHSTFYVLLVVQSISSISSTISPRPYFLNTVSLFPVYITAVQIVPCCRVHSA